LYSRQRVGTFVRRLPDEGGALQHRQIAIVHRYEVVPPFVQRMFDGLRDAVQLAGGTTREVRYEPVGPPITVVPDAWATVVFHSLNVAIPEDDQRLVMVSPSDNVLPQMKNR